jgi:choline dehydrogenase-like flavoprotein
MVIDIRHLVRPDPVDTDICIIGGGMAGIVIALELGRRGMQVCLLESGGFAEHRETNDLYNGENAGLPYEFAKGHRSRFLGGSSNCWGGHCRPLDDEDFEPRDWVPRSGWPISKAELTPYYEDAHRWLGLGPRNFDPEFWESRIDRPDARLLHLFENGIEEIITQFSPPVRMGRLHREELINSPSISVFLWANVMELVRARGEDRVREVVTKTLGGRTNRFRAWTFILATGGIENARLLLLSRRDQTEGLGNQYGLVGRCFMDHPRMVLGKFKRNRNWRPNNLFDFKYNYQNPAVSAHGTRVAGHFRLSPLVQERERVLNAYSWLLSRFPLEESVNAGNLKRLRQSLRTNPPFSWPVLRALLRAGLTPHEVLWRLVVLHARPRAWVTHHRLEIVIEQSANPESRVSLSDQLDALGANRVKVKWQLGDLERHTFQKNFSIVAAALQKHGLDLVEGANEALNRPDWAHFAQGTYHHIGTTRMHASRTQGVVDPDCKVHDLENLYIAGSSVFPTGGAHTPTMTLVALAVRLARHIRAQSLGTIEVSSDEEIPPLSLAET